MIRRIWRRDPKENDATHPQQYVHNDDNVRQNQLEKNGHNTPWDTTSDINIYWKYLDDLTKNIEAKDIATSGD